MEVYSAECGLEQFNHRPLCGRCQRQLRLYLLATAAVTAVVIAMAFGYSFSHMMVKMISAYGKNAGHG